MIYLYRILINVVLILSPIIILLRLLKNKEDKTRFKEKLCFFSKKRKKGNLIWIHVASVGEMLSIIPLIRRLEKKKNINQILLTSSTLSSSNLFKKFNFNKTIHQFFPIDVGYLTKKFLNYWKPNLVLFVESEIWPNMLTYLNNYSIKCVLLNARLTKKSFNRWVKFRSLSSKLFKSFYSVYPQNEETRIFLKKLGCKKIIKLGNLKFSDINENFKPVLNKNIIKNKKIWCASSTHSTEEIIAAKTHKKLKSKLKNIFTIIIPRHVDRSNQIVQSIKKLNLNVQLHSLKKKIEKNTDIYIVDTYGETKNFFKISNTVFLGGSLINHGGQNPLEAARFGCKILHGKHISNFREIYSLLKKNNQSFQINSQNHLDYIVKKSLINKYKPAIFIERLNKIGDKILKKTEEEITKLI